MTKILTGTLLAMVLAAGPALAQATAPAAPAAPAPSVDAAIQAKFKALDKSGNGVLEGDELATLKPNLQFIDTNKDGKVTLAEFEVGVKTGVIK